MNRGDVDREVIIRSLLPIFGDATLSYKVKVINVGTAFFSCDCYRDGQPDQEYEMALQIMLSEKEPARLLLDAWEVVE